MCFTQCLLRAVPIGEHTHINWNWVELRELLASGDDQFSKFHSSCTLYTECTQSFFSERNATKAAAKVEEYVQVAQALDSDAHITMKNETRYAGDLLGLFKQKQLAFPRNCTRLLRSRSTVCVCVCVFSYSHCAVLHSIYTVRCAQRID